MTARGLTGRQREVLEWIRGHIRETGVPPSRSEMARGLGFAFPSAAESHLGALERKGFLQIDRGKDRGMRLLREGAPLLDPEDLSEAAAVEDRTGHQRLDDYDSMTERFEAPPDYYLKVHGDSMDQVGFSTGDIVAVRREPAPVGGEVVVVRIGNEVTLKRFWRRDADTIELKPESSNPGHRVLRVGPDTGNFQIVGVVVGAIIGSRRTENAHKAVQAA